MSEEFRHIVRIVGTDIDGSERLEYGLTKIKGVDVNMAKAILRAADLDPGARVGNLTDKEVQRIVGVLEDPTEHGIPTWLLNRRKDLETGRGFHLVGPDLTLRVKSDIDLMKQTRSWKGVRHSLGLKVRGQRTKTTGRTGRVVGVRRKRVLARAFGERKKKK